MLSPISLINKQIDARKYKKNVINAIDCIMDCKFWIHEDGVHTCYHFVDKSQFDENKNIVSFKVSNEVAEFFLNLKDSPTFYALKDMLALSTIFQANVFSWLSAERNKTKPRIDIDTAKTIFNNEKEIQNKRFIAKLDDAIAAINRKTSLEVSYDKIVKGRKLIAIEFNIKNHYKKTK